MPSALKYEFLFVGRDEESFLENYAYDISEEMEGKEGHLFVSVEVQNNPADAETIGDIIFDTIRTVYFEESESTDTYDKFEDALREVNKKLKKLKSEKVSGYIGNLNVLIAIFQNDILHLTQCGDSEAYLIRRRFVSSISDGLSEGGDSEDVFSNIASGTVEPGDAIVFSSTRLLRYMTKNDLGRSALAKTPANILAELRDLISTEILGKVGLAAIVFNKVEHHAENPDMPKLEVEEKTTVAVSKGGSFMSKVKESASSISLSNISFDKAKEQAQSVVSDLRSGGMNKQKILAMLIAVVLLLTFGVWYAKGQSEKKDQILAYEKVLTEASENVNMAKTQGQYDKEAAGITLALAEKKAQEVLNSGYYRSKANEVLQEAQAAKDLLDNINRVTEPRVYVDLSTKRNNVSALGLIAAGEGHLYAYEYNALYEMVLDQVKDPITLDQSEQVIGGTYFDDRKSLLFLTESGKILEYKDGALNFMDTAEGAFHKAVDIDDWGSRVYLLDPSNKQIWRYSYSGARDQFGVGEAYITDADASDAVSLTIDGSVYLLKAKGLIEKLFTGAKEALALKKLPFSAPTAPDKIWTDAESNKLYVLDPGSSKLYVYLKDDAKDELVYSNQYLFENVGELRDFYIDTKNSKIYLLDQSKIYEVPM